MTASTIVAALAVGVGVGLLGRLFVPTRRAIPIWLPIAAGVLAALTGTVVVRVTGLVTAGFNHPELLLQLLLASVGVAVVVGSAGDRRRPWRR